MRIELNKFEISTTELTACDRFEETRVYSIGHEDQTMQALYSHIYYWLSWRGVCLWRAPVLELTLKLCGITHAGDRRNHVQRLTDSVSFEVKRIVENIDFEGQVGSSSDVWRKVGVRYRRRKNMKKLEDEVALL